MSALAQLADELRREGGLIAEAVVDPPPQAGGEDELLVEAIREGYLLHYGTPRIVRTDDPDLALLAGDRLYALGLARLADRGDLEGVRILADVIAQSARAHAEDDPPAAERAWADGLARLAG